MRTRTHWIVLALALVVLAPKPTHAQWIVHDPTTTARNAITAALKLDQLNTLTLEMEKLRRMARRLSEFTNLRKYAIANTPLWRTHDAQNSLFANAYRAAMNYGDALGLGAAAVTRTRLTPASLPTDPRALAAINAALATLDAADSALIAATDQAGLLRYNGRGETLVLDALETDVLNPSFQQSTTAVLDKLSGAGLLEIRQKQARLELLAAFVEELVIDEKRTRDAETAVLNMQLGRVLGGRTANAGLTAGAANDLRTWRQP